MSTVINKTTKRILYSVNTPDYPAGEWIINPDFPDCEPKYYRIKNDTVVEMTAAQKKVVDDAAAAAAMKIQKEELIRNKLTVIGTDALKADGVLDGNGDIIGG